MHFPPTFSALTTLCRGHKFKDLNVATRVGLKPMMTSLFTELNRSSLLLPGFLHP